MQFNVSGLLQDGIGETRSAELDDALTPLEGDGAPEPVAGAIEMLRTRDGVLVRADLVLLTPDICARCLATMVQRVPIVFEEEFRATLDPRTGEVVRGTDLDPDAFVIDSQHTLDLTDAVRQYREVSIAMQPLCRPDCRGLCPDCGQDLNQGECDCASRRIDSRWVGLQALREALPEGKE